MSRIAAIDCGTNSLRLLIAEDLPAGAPDRARGSRSRGAEGHMVRDVCRIMRIVRLGEGVDETGRLSTAAIDRVRAVLEEYVLLMRRERVEAVRMVATSATRDAENRADFFAMTSELLDRVAPGAVAEVIGGTEEASLSFAGAVGDLSLGPGPVCVIDLGGGSTECAVGRPGDATLMGSVSMQMGCVRLTEKIMRSDPPAPREIDRARAYIRARLDEVRAAVPVAEAGTFVGCAGTFTTLSALAQGLERYDPAAIHGSRLRFDALRAVTGRLIGETAATRALNPVIHPGRADVIGAGAVIVEELMRFVEDYGASSFLVSEKDILDGIVLSLMR